MLVNSKINIRALGYSPHKEAGVSLIESLVALLVLALGIMGLAGVQTRVLVDTRTANHRATAISLINDMSNRMLLNRDVAVQGSYNSVWGATVAAKNCVSSASNTTRCTGAELAQSDLNLWLANVRSVLPSGDAQIFTSTTDARQIGIAIAWAANESVAAPLSAASNPLAVTAAQNGVACPANAICHVMYVQP